MRLHQEPIAFMRIEVVLYLVLVVLVGYDKDISWVYKSKGPLVGHSKKRPIAQKL